MTEEKDNKAIWDQVCKTQPRHAKEFKKGGFKGTSVNPIFNAEKATEIFGPAGKGWGVNHLQKEIQELDEDTVMISEEVELWYIWNEDRCSVSHWASEFIKQRVNKQSDTGGYIKIDDEAWKKCRTNATSKCFSLLGFSADLWMGYYENSSYIQEREKEQNQQDYAKILKANFKQAIEIMNTFCLCKTDEERETVAKWAALDLGVTLGSMQVTPNLSSDILQALAEAKKNGVKSHEMLSRAKEWLAAQESTEDAG